MKVLISGASVSAGYGLDHEKHDPKLWINQLIYSKQHTAIVDNISITGIDNQQIMHNTVSALRSNSYDLAIVCWQSLHRINYNYGYELYNTQDCITMPSEVKDIRLVGNTPVSKKGMTQTKKHLMSYFNYYWSILDLIGYLNIVIDIAKIYNTPVYFVNYSMPWGNNKIFDYLNEFDVNLLDTFTKDNLLQLDSRDDNEVKELYQNMICSWKSRGDIQSTNWLNLYSPLLDMQVDVASKNNNHPGYLSQDKFYNHLVDKFIV